MEAALCAVYAPRDPIQEFWQRKISLRALHALIIHMPPDIASTLQAVPLLVNKLRNYSLSWLACGVLSLAATLVCVKCFNWGIYAVAAIPQFVDIFANVTFVPVYAALCLRLPWSKFYCVYAQYLVSTILAAALGSLANTMLSIPQSNWIGLLTSCAITALLTLASDLLLLLGKRERTMILRKLMRRSRP